jgi:hypothetical protein
MRHGANDDAFLEARRCELQSDFLSRVEAGPLRRILRK